VHRGFWWGDLGKRPFGRPRRRWEILLKCIFKKREGGMQWIDLAQNSDRWRAILNAVLNLRVPYNAWDFLTS
jgi:hypothetical protein